LLLQHNGEIALGYSFVMGDLIIAFIDTPDNSGILTANTYNQFQNY
jgi:hypothetical protein